MLERVIHYFSRIINSQDYFVAITFSRMFCKMLEGLCGQIGNTCSYNQHMIFATLFSKVLKGLFANKGNIVPNDNFAIAFTCFESTCGNTRDRIRRVFIISIIGNNEHRRLLSTLAEPCGSSLTTRQGIRNATVLKVLCKHRLHREHQDEQTHHRLGPLGQESPRGRDSFVSFHNSMMFLFTT